MPFKCKDCGNDVGIIAYILNWKICNECFNRKCGGTPMRDVANGNTYGLAVEKEKPIDRNYARKRPGRRLLWGWILGHTRSDGK